jgi:hypothetical protein
MMLAPQQDESWKQDPWLGVNPFDPAFKDDPYPFLRRLREYDPINETPIGLVRRHQPQRWPVRVHSAPGSAGPYTLAPFDEPGVHTARRATHA